MKINVIAAVAENGVIGADGKIPWTIPEDLKLFAKLTKGDGNNAVIMGGRTWFSIPKKFRPLSGRLNIVLSRSSLVLQGALQEGSLPEAFESARRAGAEEAWVCGGQSLYQEVMTRHVAPDAEFQISELHITHVGVAVAGGDTFFPFFSGTLFPNKGLPASPSPILSKSGISYSYRVYRLRNQDGETMRWAQGGMTDI